MGTLLFDDLTDVYEALIDWPKRLGHEGPMFKRRFEEAGVRRVVDVACGTGHHAARFHSWGLAVEGADVSPKMIDRARANFGETSELRWIVRGFEESVAARDPFDAAVCIGNSLALAPNPVAAQQAIREMFAAVRPGGLVIVQVLNLWRLPDGPCIWQKCKRVQLAEGDFLAIKGVHRSATRGYVDLVVANPHGGAMQTDSSTLIGLEEVDLSRMARHAGAASVEFYGGYQDEPYEREKSVDLVMIARR